MAPPDKIRPWWSVIVGYDDKKKPYITHLTGTRCETKLDAVMECQDYISAMQGHPDLQNSRVFVCQKRPNIANLDSAVDVDTIELIGVPALDLGGGSVIPIVSAGKGEKSH